jgi:hypothetical protein
MDVWEQYRKDALDPEVYTRGKPLTNEDGSPKWYKSYWMVTYTDDGSPDIINTHNEISIAEQTGIINLHKDENKTTTRILKSIARRIRQFFNCL